ncbi:hypothetical protein CYMTET_55472 [Cymbomonas tetramitiformis]|uniref:Nitroreductase domain-containing protein n=1 Tax=Cymbomonas tetramitiformis TaxID=36881 RepID=A0AAE0BDA4_9CHLO|nr:hypothetical protein CYMTET_55472 [Cymbomonas tetramitiformis]
MLYDIVGIKRDDLKGRATQMAKNFTFFDAPMGLIFTIDKQMQQGQWVDLGMFMQSICLLARERGLHTCAQEAWAEFTSELRSELSVPENQMVFCGMAVGYIGALDVHIDDRDSNWSKECASIIKGFPRRSSKPHTFNQPVCINALPLGQARFSAESKGKNVLRKPVTGGGGGADNQPPVAPSPRVPVVLGSALRSTPGKSTSSWNCVSCESMKSASGNLAL